MRALLGPSRRAGLRARRHARPEPLTIPSLQGTPIPQSPPLKLGNIVGRATVRLFGALLLEQHDEWAVQRRYMSLETLGAMRDNSAVSLPAVIG